MCKKVEFLGQEAEIPQTHEHYSFPQRGIAPFSHLLKHPPEDFRESMRIRMRVGGRILKVIFS